MNTDWTFHRSGTGPAGREAGRVPSLPMPAIHPSRQPAIPDEGRWAKKLISALSALTVNDNFMGMHTKPLGQEGIQSRSASVKVKEFFTIVAHEKMMVASFCRFVVG